MILDGMHFVYGDFRSLTYGLVFAHLDTAEYRSVIGSTKSAWVYNNNNRHRYFIGDTYEDSPVEFDVEIVAIDNTPLTNSQCRVVERALFYQQGYKKLYADASEDIDLRTCEMFGETKKKYYLKCRFTNPERIETACGETIGFKARLECDSHMMYMDSITKEIESDSFDEGTFEFPVITDEREYTYPIVTITTGNTGGDISICNMSDDEERITAFDDIDSGEKIIMTGETNHISGDFYSNMSGKNFIRFVSGLNQFEVTGDVSCIKFEWTPRRYM